MQQINLAAVDLNLLVVLDALLAERSVTRAALRLRLTQPAVSHALGRLRSLLRDPLLVRGPAGMVPTPLALALAPRLVAVLRELGCLLAPARAFDPASSTRSFTLGMSDYAASVVLPALARRLADGAPNVTLVARDTNHGEGLALLDAGTAELVVGNFPEPPKRVASEALFQEGFACALRAGHPALAGSFDLDAYLGCAHLNVSLRGEPTGYVDRVLARHRLRRRLTLVAGHFLMAPALVAATDLVATEPERVLLPAAARLGLELRPVPFAVPAFAVVQMWPHRLDADAGHAWLRDQVRAACLPDAG